MNIEALKKEYAEQDNRWTAYPIFVTVQEKRELGIMEDDSPNIPTAFQEYKYFHPKLEPPRFYDTRNEIIEDLSSYCGDDVDETAKMMCDIEEKCVWSAWIDIEWCLTIGGAEKYIEADKHNHCELRTYVRHFNSRNTEMHNLLRELGFKTKDEESYKPADNIRLTTKQISEMKHALGGEFKKDAYRNHYVLNEPSESWEELVSIGFATKREVLGQTTYHVTDKAIEALQYI